MELDLCGAPSSEEEDEEEGSICPVAQVTKDLDPRHCQGGGSTLCPLLVVGEDRRNKRKGVPLLFSLLGLCLVFRVYRSGSLG